MAALIIDRIKHDKQMLIVFLICNMFYDKLVIITIYNK